jgi:hypothetical protein
MSEITPAVEEGPGIGDNSCHVQRNDEVPIFPRIVAVEITVDEERRNLVRLLKIVVRDQDAVEQSELAEVLVTEA